MLRIAAMLRVRPGPAIVVKFFDSHLEAMPRLLHRADDRPVSLYRGRRLQLLDDPAVELELDAGDVNDIREISVAPDVRIDQDLELFHVRLVGPAMALEVRDGIVTDPEVILHRSRKLGGKQLAQAFDDIRVAEDPYRIVDARHVVHIANERGTRRRRLGSRHVGGIDAQGSQIVQDPLVMAILVDRVLQQPFTEWLIALIDPRAGQRIDLGGGANVMIRLFEEAAVDLPEHFAVLGVPGRGLLCRKAEDSGDQRELHECRPGIGRLLRASLVQHAVTSPRRVRSPNGPNRKADPQPYRGVDVPPEVSPANFDVEIWKSPAEAIEQEA